jgi:transcriptional regulator with XRE-family HTH domain
MTLYYITLTLPATMKRDRPMPADDEFRAKLRDILARSGRSMRALSAALGRDPGYVAALLDPSRPSRARPTPADLLRASDGTGIPFVELLEALWGVEPQRLANELAALGLGVSADTRLARLSEAERAEVSDFVDFLVTRRSRRSRPRSGPTSARS